MALSTRTALSASSSLRPFSVLAFSGLLFLALPASGESWTKAGRGIFSLLATGRTDSRNVYAVDADGHVQRSTDGGKTWKLLPLAPAGPVMAIATAPADSSKVYAAAGVQLFASTDGGESWGLRSSALPATCPHPADPSITLCPVLSLLVDPASSDRILAGSSAAVLISFIGDVTAASPGWGLVQSTDGGRSWVPETAFPASEAFSLVASGDGSTIYAPGLAGIAVSQDRGATWRTAGTSVPLDVPRSGAVGISPADPCQALASDPGYLTTVIATTDCGQTWTQAAQGIAGGRGRVDKLLASQSVPGTFYGVFSGTLFSTTTAGKAWGRVCAPPQMIVNDLVRLEPGADRFLVASGWRNEIWSWDVAAPWSETFLPCHFALDGGETLLKPVRR